MAEPGKDGLSENRSRLGSGRCTSPQSPGDAGPGPALPPRAPAAAPRSRSAQPPLTPSLALSTTAGTRTRAHRDAASGLRARALLWHGSRRGLRRRLVLRLRRRLRAHAAAMSAPARDAPGRRRRRGCGGGARALMGSAARGGLRVGRRRQRRRRGLEGRLGLEPLRRRGRERSCGTRRLHPPQRPQLSRRPAASAAAPAGQEAPPRASAPASSSGPAPEASSSAPPTSGPASTSPEAPGRPDAAARRKYVISQHRPSRTFCFLTHHPVWRADVRARAICNCGTSAGIPGVLIRYRHGHVLTRTKLPHPGLE